MSSQTAFVATPFARASTATSLTSSFTARPVSFAAASVRANKATIVATPRPLYVQMVEKAPESSVLGLGAGVPGIAFLILSVVALAGGSYAVYESNLAKSLTVDSVNALYVIGSLLLPISWGLHVAAWIQFQNKK